ncbi:MAG: GNAT family N-acetyltransferase [Clostridia bacterium]
MEIRKITPEERLTASKIQTIAFFSSRDFSQASENPQEFQKNYETGRAVFNEAGKMCACLELIPYEIRFLGHTVKMGGIGGVATLPEERQRGYIRKLFTYCFDEMQENGQVFSYLYPFSHAYYRQFGYETCLNLIQYTIPFSSFSHFPKRGEFRFYLPDMERKDLVEVYNKFIEDKNLAIVRNDRMWQDRLGQDPYKTVQYTYIWYNEKNEARGYVQFQLKRKENAGPDMDVKELIWLDRDTLVGILGNLKVFAAQFQNFLWRAPEFLNLPLLFPEVYHLKQELVTSGMNRIVDLKKALSLVRYPEKAGSIVLEVRDNFLPWNNGTFSVAWDKGEVEVKESSKSPDLICDIQGLTQLLTGYVSLDDLLLREATVVHKAYSLLSSLFPKKPLYLADYF